MVRSEGVTLTALRRDLRHVGLHVAPARPGSGGLPTGRHAASRTSALPFPTPTPTWTMRIRAPSRARDAPGFLEHEVGALWPGATSPEASPGSCSGTTKAASAPNDWSQYLRANSTPPTGTCSPCRARAGSGWRRERPAWTTSSWPATGPPAGSTPAPWRPPPARGSWPPVRSCPERSVAGEPAVTSGGWCRGSRASGPSETSSASRSSLRHRGGPLRRDHRPRALRRRSSACPEGAGTARWAAHPRGRSGTARPARHLGGDPRAADHGPGSTPRARCGSTTARPLRHDEHRSRGDQRRVRSFIPRRDLPSDADTSPGGPRGRQRV